MPPSQGKGTDFYLGQLVAEAENIKEGLRGFEAKVEADLRDLDARVTSLEKSVATPTVLGRAVWQAAQFGGMLVAILVSLRALGVWH